MTVVDGRVVLNMWNGRPTVEINVINGAPVLRWLLVGHANDFDIWFNATLTWDEADTICGSSPAGFDLLNFLSGTARDVVYELAMDGAISVRGEVQLPVGKDNIRAGAQEFLAMVEARLSAKAVGGVRSETQALLAV